MEQHVKLAAWVPLADVPGQDRAVTVDVGLARYRTGPGDGRVAPVPVGGLVRQ
ncbi:hypothetical protein [Actinoplanes sp. NPDC051851]|uniref:hypothetical protein n=1 Tax=Actinoplanes sp. NPDC051851 TaxID=3154753 RepID=UPI003438457E